MSEVLKLFEEWLYPLDQYIEMFVYDRLNAAELDAEVSVKLEQ
jgi:hypothetical protein